MAEYSKVVAIDGPSGSGKSTVAKMISHKMGFLYVDTGAMFRAIGLYLSRQGISLEDEKAIAIVLDRLSFKYGQSPECLVEVHGENLTKEIRAHHVSDLASRVSKLPVIRSYLKTLQRDLAFEKICVMEGRDIGTAVFPQAFCKIFLTASLDIRAERRFKELKDKGMGQLTFDEIRRDIEQRDQRDTQRTIDPLKKAEDALYFDSSHLDLQEVTQKLCDYIKMKMREAGLSL